MMSPRRDPGLGDVGGRAPPEPAVEGVGHSTRRRRCRPAAAAKWGRPRLSSAGRLGHHLVVGDRQAQLGQALGELVVAGHPVGAQPGQLVLEGALLVVDEVDEDVGARARNAQETSQPPTSSTPSSLRPRPGRGQAGQGVVVGERHAPAAGRRGQLGDRRGRIGAVRGGRVGVQVDHARRTIPGHRRGRRPTEHRRGRPACARLPGDDAGPRSRPIGGGTPEQRGEQAGP